MTNKPASPLGGIRPDFLTMAREWLVRAQGHARAPHEESLALELERMWELGIANSIEAVDAIDRTHLRPNWLDTAIAPIRALTDKPTDPRGN